MDGVRARWDGKYLISRGGNVFAPPEWFTNGFPATPIDGELLMGRGLYEEVSSIVRMQLPHVSWRKVRLIIFDVSSYRGSFEERVTAMKRLFTKNNSPYLAMIEQERVVSEQDLLRRLQR